MADMTGKIEISPNANIGQDVQSSTFCCYRDFILFQDVSQNTKLQQVLGRVLDVVLGKRRDEKVRVVIVVLVADREAGDAIVLGGLFQVLGQQLPLLVKVVAGADVDQEGHLLALPAGARDELGRVVRLPGFLVGRAEVAGEGLFAPGAFRRVGDGRKGADALVLARVLEEQGQGAVPAHGVAGDGDAAAVQLVAELGKDGLGQLVAHVRLHVVVARPGGLGGVDVEAGARAKVPGIRLAGQVGAPRRRVGEQHCDAGLGGGLLEEALFRAVLGCAL
jgi:hypothetical protein